MYPTPESNYAEWNEVFIKKMYAKNFSITFNFFIAFNFIKVSIKMWRKQLMGKREAARASVVSYITQMSLNTFG